MRIVAKHYGEPKTPIAKRLQEFFAKENSNTIAGKIDMTRQQVSRQLQGEVNPNFKLLLFAAEQGADLTYILTGSPYSGAPTPDNEKEKSPQKPNDPWLDIVSDNWNNLNTKEKAAFAGEIAAKAEAKSKQDGTNVG